MYVAPESKVLFALANVAGASAETEPETTEFVPALFPPCV